MGNDSSVGRGKLNAERCIAALSGQQLLSSLRDGLNSFSLLLLTPEGEILYANRNACTSFRDHDTESIVGHTLREVTNHEWVDERIQMLHKAVEEWRELIVLEILSGFRLCTNIKPIEIKLDGHIQRLLLVTVELIIAANFYWLLDHMEENNVVIADCNDLGCLNILSDRELEVLALMGQGYRQKDIAKRLSRSISTVNRHRESIGEKLQITDRAMLVRLANIAMLQVSDAKRKRMVIGQQFTATELLGFQLDPIARANAVPEITAKSPS